MHFNTLLILCLLAQYIYISNQQTHSPSVKHILLFAFPGGKSHCFIFKELITYTINKLINDNSSFYYKFHILVHEFDYNLWLNLGLPEHYYQLYTFGSKEQYLSKFVDAMSLAKRDPIFGYNNFNKAMIFLNEEFINSDLILKFKYLPFKFELIITDVINMIAPFLKRELNINKLMYVNPTCIYTWNIPNMEYNASYEPILGTSFTDEMSFMERLFNFIIKKGIEFMYHFFISSQNKPFIQHNYKPLDPFQSNSLFLNQCVNGIHFPLSLPPNIIQAGAFLPKPPSTLQDIQLNIFLQQHMHNIYVSQGTITKAMNLNMLISLFKAFPEVGFVFNVRKDININEDVGENVLIREWVSQNDLLGDERVDVFITHGGLNSILESIYHGKPMIVIGTSIDQVNSAAVVKKRGYGVVFIKEKEATEEGIVNAVKEVLGNKEYKERVLKGAKIVKENDGKEKFYYWLNYVIENGYEHLVIPFVVNDNAYKLFGLDVFGIIIGVGILVLGMFLFIKGKK